jgi:F-type H+-transporting ATPase subunit b
VNINFTIIMQAVAFAVFIWGCARFIWPPLMRAIDERQKTIADGLAAGEQGRENLATSEKRVADLIAKARAEAHEIVAQGEKQRSETVEHAKTEARTEADRIVAAAKAEIEQEVARAKEELRQQVSKLAVFGAGKILEREVDPAAHSAMLREIEAQL